MARACLEKAFCKMCVTICGRFRLDEGAVAGYGNRIRVKSPAKWGVQIAGMLFQTRSNCPYVMSGSDMLQSNTCLQITTIEQEIPARSTLCSQPALNPD